MKRILAYLAIALVIVGCSFGGELQSAGDPQDMTPSSLAGTWREGTDRYFTFNEDGTFAAIDLPPAPFKDDLKSMGVDPAHSRIDGSGTWTLLADPNAGSPPPRSVVDLRFDHLAGQATFFSGPYLNAVRAGDGKVYLVFFYLGRDDATAVYLKCAGSCVVPSPVIAPTTPQPRPS